MLTASGIYWYLHIGDRLYRCPYSDILASKITGCSHQLPLLSDLAIEIAKIREDRADGFNRQVGHTWFNCPTIQFTELTGGQYRMYTIEILYNINPYINISLLSTLVIERIFPVGFTINIQILFLHQYKSYSKRQINFSSYNTSLHNTCNWDRRRYEDTVNFHRFQIKQRWIMYSNQMLHIVRNIKLTSNKKKEINSQRQASLSISRHVPRDRNACH